MRRWSLGCLSVLFLAGCAGGFSGLPVDTPVHTLTLRWQRLVDASDETCPRCASTEREVHKAFEHLKTSLAPAGIRVALETERLDEAAFQAAPLESNRIWIGGRSLEEWLGAQAASSPCCAACGDAECRTLAVGGATYEAIPAALIVRAGFMAAAGALQAGTPAPVPGS
ncbi:MAG: DUF2703 domain-containing protein [Candidatus Eisenbacteria bacterium]